MAKLFKTPQYTDRSKSRNLMSRSGPVYARSDPFLRQFPIILLATVLTVIGHADAMDKAVIPAFPGAEGAGALTPGGRGGKVLEVTNLNDNGPGSLRTALEAQGPRIVIFRISGIITLEKPLTISNPYVTVAGQTAPMPADSDHDGIPDAWEKKFDFEWNNSSDGVKDADKDGYTNVEEWLNRTNPTEFVDYRIGKNNRSSSR